MDGCDLCLAVVSVSEWVADMGMNSGLLVCVVRSVSLCGAAVYFLDALPLHEVSRTADAAAIASRQAIVRDIVICDVFCCFG